MFRRSSPPSKRDGPLCRGTGIFPLVQKGSPDLCRGISQYPGFALRLEYLMTSKINAVSGADQTGLKKLKCFHDSAEVFDKETYLAGSSLVSLGIRFNDMIPSPFVLSNDTEMASHLFVT